MIGRVVHSPDSYWKRRRKGVREMNPFEVFLYQINQKRGTSVPASRGSRTFPSA
jgi:hypothetical protein